MKAVRLETHRQIAPFNDRVGAVQVLNEALEARQQAALDEAGIELVAAAPSDEPFLLYSDRTWFTADVLRRLRAAGTGRLKVDHDDWWFATGPLQDVPEPGLYELAVVPAGGAPSFAGLPALTVDLGLEPIELPEIHARMRHATRPLFGSAAMVHQVDHWTHILRVNQLALIAMGAALKKAFDEANWLKKLWLALVFLLKARSLKPHRVLRALSQIHPSAKVHPTAVIETSFIGPNAEVGPYAVLRGAVLAEGARVEEFGIVNASCIGERSVLGRQAMCNLSVIYPDTQVSSGGGFQACLFGRDTFIAVGATILDLSFGRTIGVYQDGQRVDSGQHFLGTVVGHEVVIGNGVRVGYGMEIPNGTFLLADTDDLLRYKEGIEPGVPVIVRNGRAEPLKKTTKPAPESPNPTRPVEVTG